MNLIFNSSDIKLVGVKEDLETISFRDDIGFSTGDLIPGFNTSDVVTSYIDGAAIPYPAPEEVVVYLESWHIPYDDTEDLDAIGESLEVTRTSKVVLDPVNDADVADPNFDYEDVMNTWDVAAPKDGRIKTRLFAVGVDAVGDDYYYETATGNLMRSIDSTVVEIAEVGEELSSTPAAVEVNLLKTSKLDANIADIINRYTKLTIRGKCKDEDSWRKHILFLQTGRTAAKVQFDTYGNMFNATRIIESLEQYIKVNDLEIVD